MASSSPIELSPDGHSWRFASVQTGLDFLFSPSETLYCRGVNRRGIPCTFQLLSSPVEELLVSISNPGETYHEGCAASRRDKSVSKSKLAASKSLSFVSDHTQASILKALVKCSLCLEHSNSLERHFDNTSKVLQNWKTLIDKELSHLKVTLKTIKKVRPPSETSLNHAATISGSVTLQESPRTPSRPLLRRRNDVTTREFARAYESDSESDIKHRDPLENFGLGQTDPFDTESDDSEAADFEDESVLSAATPPTAMSMLWSPESILSKRVDLNSSPLQERRHPRDFTKSQTQDAEAGFQPRQLFSNHEFRHPCYEDRGLSESPPLLISPPASRPVSRAETSTAGISVNFRDAFSVQLESSAASKAPVRSSTMPVTAYRDLPLNPSGPSYISRRHSFHNVEDYRGQATDFDETLVDESDEILPARLNRRKSTTNLPSAEESDEEEFFDANDGENGAVACNEVNLISMPSYQNDLDKLQTEGAPTARDKKAGTVLASCLGAKHDSVFKPYREDEKMSAAMAILVKLQETSTLLVSSHLNSTMPGYVYGYISREKDGIEDGYIKIGVEKNDPGHRTNEWSEKCKRRIEMRFCFPMRRAMFVERMIALQFSWQRQYKTCNTCKTPEGVSEKHDEWYQLSEKEAKESVRFWQRFMNVHPYMKEGGILLPDWAKWIEKEVIRVHSSGRNSRWRPISKTGPQHRKELERVMSLISKWLKWEETTLDCTRCYSPLHRCNTCMRARPNSTTSSQA